MPAARRSRPRSTRYGDRKSTRLNSSHTVIYTLSLHDALPIYDVTIATIDEAGVALAGVKALDARGTAQQAEIDALRRSEEHTSELQSHSDLHSFPTRRSSDLRRDHRHDRRGRRGAGGREGARCPRHGAAGRDRRAT